MNQNVIFMRLSKNIFSVILVLFIGGLLFGGLFESWRCNYKNVATPDGSPYHHLKASQPPLYVVKDGNLYLLSDKRKYPSAIFFTVIVIPQVWTREKLGQLIADHPELEKMMPNVKNGSFGIEWIEKRKDNNGDTPNPQSPSAPGFSGR